MNDKEDMSYRSLASSGKGDKNLLPRFPPAEQKALWYNLAGMPEEPIQSEMDLVNGVDFEVLVTTENVILDVRSPAEYRQGHIPGAVNVPLFSDDDRARVGKTYKEKGSRAAVKEGLRLAGPRLTTLVETVENLLGSYEVSRRLWVYCWRGGMRSASVAWLLQQAGFRPSTIKGGYKAFRRWVLATFEQSFPLALLGGFTGAGKTRLLRNMESKGFPVVDLEALACHQGSAFGHLGQSPQPTQQQFENTLALHLRRAATLAAQTGSPVWMEDESRFIGSLYLPPSLWQRMQQAPLYILPDEKERRLDNLIRDYGAFSPAELAAAILKLRKRLGPDKTAAVLAELGRGNLRNVAALLLDYYDKAYDYCIAQRQGPSPVFMPNSCLDPLQALAFLEKVQPHTVLPA